MIKVKKKSDNLSAVLVKRSSSGLGLFAAKQFKKGDFIIEYTGRLLSAPEADRKGGKYLFQINSHWTVDGADRKNIARYINHSCRPNCDVYTEGKKIKVYANCKIDPREELTYDYGQEYFDEYIKPIGCKCAFCQGK